MTVLNLKFDESLSFAEELALLQALVAPYTDILRPVPPIVGLKVVGHLSRMSSSLELHDQCAMYDIVKDYYRFLPPGMFILLMSHTTSTISLILRDRVASSNKEAEYTEKLLAKFSEVFPGYDLVGTQAKTKAGGVMDILAKDKASGRDVIIELKLGKKNPARQLYGYAVDFDNPILVAINEASVKSKSDNVTYLLFSELLEAA